MISQIESQNNYKIDLTCFNREKSISLEKEKKYFSWKEITPDLQLNQLQQGKILLAENDQSQTKSDTEGYFYQNAGEKLKNWAIGFGYVKDDTKEEKIQNFQSTLDQLSPEEREKYLIQKAQNCEVPGQQSGLMCWENTQAVGEAVITAGGISIAGNTTNELFTFSSHAELRMLERGMGKELVFETIKNGIKRPDKIPGRTIFELASENSSAGRGTRVILEDITNRVITIIDMGSKFKP